MNQFAKRSLLVTVSLILVLTSGCGLLDRSEVLRSDHVVLDGYAYDADLERVGDAHLELEVEVVRFQKFRQKSQTQLRG